MGVGSYGPRARRDSMNARPGSSRCSSCTRMPVLAHVGDVDDAQLAVRVEHHALLAVGAEADGLAVLERDEHVGPHLLARDVVERAVVEDVAVLVDLHERRALVGVGPAEHLSSMWLRSMSWVRATNVASAPSATRHRVERVVERAERRRLGDLAHLADVGEYWPLVSP